MTERVFDRRRSVDVVGELDERLSFAVILADGAALRLWVVDATARSGAWRGNLSRPS